MCNEMRQSQGKRSLVAALRKEVAQLEAMRENLRKEITSSGT